MAPTAGCAGGSFAPAYDQALRVAVDAMLGAAGLLCFVARDILGRPHFKFGYNKPIAILTVLPKTHLRSLSLGLKLNGVCMRIEYENRSRKTGRRPMMAHRCKSSFSLLCRFSSRRLQQYSTCTIFKHAPFNSTQATFQKSKNSHRTPSQLISDAEVQAELNLKNLRVPDATAEALRGVLDAHCQCGDGYETRSHSASRRNATQERD